MKKKYILLCTDCKEEFKIKDARKINSWDGKNKELVMLLCPKCKKNVNFAIWYETGRKTDENGDVIK